jgi:hypothetical protein
MEVRAKGHQLLLEQEVGFARPHQFAAMDLDLHLDVIALQVSPLRQDVPADTGDAVNQVSVHDHGGDALAAIGDSADEPGPLGPPVPGQPREMRVPGAGGPRKDAPVPSGQNVAVLIAVPHDPGETVREPAPLQVLPVAAFRAPGARRTRLHREVEARLLLHHEIAAVEEPVPPDRRRPFATDVSRQGQIVACMSGLEPSQAVQNPGKHP